jgi:hypothetical protein
MFKKQWNQNFSHKYMEGFFHLREFVSAFESTMTVVCNDGKLKDRFA